MGLFVSEERSTAALRGLRGKLRFWNDVAASLNQPSPEILDREQEAIDKLRTWAASLSFLDRMAYNGWLNFAQDGLRKARREMRTQSLAKRHQKYREEQDKLDRAVKALGNFPTPQS